jgi:hypothetical protein
VKIPEENLLHPPARQLIIFSPPPECKLDKNRIMEKETREITTSKENVRHFKKER